MVLVAKKKAARKGSPLNLWIDSDLREALERARQRNRRNLREEVSIALEKYLREMGLWREPDESAN